jgi:uncharacterized membrane protein YdbT with pleckstrin-like domain
MAIHYSANPVMFRARPLTFTICTLLIVAYGAGLLILLIWFIRCKCERVTVSDKTLQIRRGLIAITDEEIPIRGITFTQVQQSIWGRMWGVGSINFGTSGTDGGKLRVSDLPRVRRLKQLIDHFRSY